MARNTTAVLIVCFIGFGLRAQDARQRLTLVALGLDASPKSKCRVISFQPYNDGKADLAGLFTELEADRSRVPPNRYNVALSCADGTMTAQVAVTIRSQKILVSGPVGIVHDSFGPGGVPTTKVMVKDKLLTDSLFLLLSSATRENQTFLVDLAPDGAALLPNPPAGHYVFVVLGHQGIKCTGVLAIVEANRSLVVRADEKVPEFCRGVSE